MSISCCPFTGYYCVVSGCVVFVLFCHAFIYIDGSYWDFFLLDISFFGYISAKKLEKKMSAVSVSFMFQKQQTYWFKNWDFLKEFILLCHKILNISYLVTAVNIFYKPHSSNKIIYLLFCFVSDIREQIQYSWCHSKRQGSNYM